MSDGTKTFLERYVDVLVKEIETVAKNLSSDRKLTQVRWGGGAPNPIQYRFIEKITAGILLLCIYSYRS